MEDNEKLISAISKILRTKSWKIGVIALLIGVPIGFVHITRLQNAGAADDLGLWYRIYCAIAFAAPYAIGLTVVHILARIIKDNRLTQL
jgi:uncharacterized membrane-anchored protein YhcB (DUF1043 family)